MTTQPSLSSALCSALLNAEKITEKDAHNSLNYQQELGGNIGAILIRLGAISEENLLEFQSKLYHLPLLASTALPANPLPFTSTVQAAGIPLNWWLDQEVLAWPGEDGQLHYTAREPLASRVTEPLNRAFPEKKISPWLIRSYDLERGLELLKGAEQKGQNEFNIHRLKEIAEEAPVIEFVANLLSQALDQRASDIHIEPGKEQMEVRFRIDGVLYNRFILPAARYPAIGSRVKLISGIDISERRLPQDGRVSVRISGVEVDLRVSSVPGVYGESIVLRLLPKEQHSIEIHDLGMLPDHRQLLENWVLTPSGIILVTGPTGSGKSTTLYAALDTINDGKKKIITVEDPVEYYLEGITQIQTHSEIGYTFSRALRSIMRQDPDVVMVGEIRDRETAEIAIQASLTGHLVLSTLHTNSSLAAFIRLIDMGIDPFLVATPIRAVMAQRLVRCLCPHCAQPEAPPAALIEMLEPWLTPECQTIKANWKKPVGCDFCQQSGYRGRTGIHELIPVSAEMRELILDKKSEQVLWDYAVEKKIRSMKEDGLLKARRGITSIEEIFRVVAL